mmetsp:Transcript_102077/g.263917  ORF Transcript_102077/g.263917 Transcript_102077/m.263917 type:complete len:281 (-) Transcript_102077:438-1280(-)
MFVTKDHRGHAEVRICDQHLDESTPNPEGPNGCLSQWALERVPPEEVHSDCRVDDHRDDCQPLDPDHPERWYMRPPHSELDRPGEEGMGETRTMDFRIPEGLQCTSCTLQWIWWTANSCVPAKGYGCYFSRVRALGWDALRFCREDFCDEESTCSRDAPPNHWQWCRGIRADGGGNKGEEFRNCADITVLPSSGTTTVTTRTTKETVSATTTTRRTTTTMCVDCGLPPTTSTALRGSVCAGPCTTGAGLCRFSPVAGQIYCSQPGPHAANDGCQAGTTRC